MCELTFLIHCHPHASPDSTSLWTKTCDSSFSLVELKLRRASLWKTPELWHVECVFLLCLPDTVTVLPSTRWTALKRLENTTSPTVQWVATFFVNSRLIGSLECKTACDWPRVSCWPKVDSQRVGDAGSEKKKKKKNSSYKTTPCASPEWGWNNHREDACSQKYIKLWQRLTILELPRYDFTFSTRFYGHNRRRRCPPAMTPLNYTGNFVLTPAVSMDANRSANSLLPQLVWLLLLPTLQSFTGSVNVVDNPESDYDSPHHHFNSFCGGLLFKNNTAEAPFVGRLRTTARHALLELTIDLKQEKFTFTIFKSHIQMGFSPRKYCSDFEWLVL